MANIIGVSFTINHYKSAKCKCGKKLIQGVKLLSITKAQGSFNSVSNYCNDCAEEQIKLAMEELSNTMRNIINAQEELEKSKQIEKQTSEIFK